MEKEHREKNKTAKTEKANVKEAGYEEMYEDLKKNGPMNLCKPAKTRKRRALDVDKLMFIKDGRETSYVVTVR